MARINNTRMSALEFDLTSLFIRRAEPNKVQALRMVLVDGQTAVMAAEQCGLKLPALNSAKLSFWKNFESLSRSFQGLYGTLNGKALYRFSAEGDGDVVTFAEYEIGYLTDAVKGCLSVSAFEQICLLYQPNHKQRAAAYAVLCLQETMFSAADMNGMTKQMLSYTCNKMQQYASLLDAVVKTCKHYPQVRVYTLDKVDFTTRFVGGS